MRAAVFRHGQIVDRLPDPVPTQGQVLVRTAAYGICGSDLHAGNHKRQFVDLSRRASSQWTPRRQRLHPGVTIRGRSSGL